MNALADFPPITDAQHEAFEAVTSGEYNNLVLMSVLVDGKPTTAICAVTADDEQPDGLDITPLYLYVTEHLFERLTPPPIDDDGTPPEAVPHETHANLEAAQAAADAGGSVQDVMRAAMSQTCPECGRVFDLLDPDDDAEWSFGHDCEAS